MKTNRISQTKTANGIVGYDFGCRTHFETLDLASRGIAVRLNAVRGKTRYMVVTGYAAVDDMTQPRAAQCDSGKPSLRTPRGEER